MGNPFDNPTTIRDPKNFVGREDLLRRIFDLIKNKQNVSLVGAKRIGKTSLLNCLRNRTIQEKFGFAGENVLFLYLDVQDRMLKVQRDLFEDINFLLRQQSQEYPQEGISYKDDEFTSYINEFRRRGLYPVLMLDTLDEIAHYAPIDPALFSFLRSQASSGQISYITASVDLLGKILHTCLLEESLVSPFFNIFTTVRLRPFSSLEARTLLTTFSTREDRPFTEKEVNWVLNMAGYHPYFLQHVGAALFEEKQGREISKVNFQRVRKEAYQSLEKHFRDCWKMLGDAEARSLQVEVEKGGREDGDYPELSLSALFRDYMRDNEQVESILDEQALSENSPVIEMSLEEFIEILDRSRSEGQKVLGESSLTHLPFIAAQVKQKNALTPIARSLIVRESLKKALEQMRGPGLRNEESTDWLFYNILHYRYFITSRLTHNVIADRLGMSTRQYYRKRDQAIQALWQILLEMKEDSHSEMTV